jgi:hypothetical protein
MKTLSIQYCGSLAFWTPKECLHAPLEAAMHVENLGDYIPSVRSDSSALKLACEKYAQGQCPVGMDYEVSALSQPGTNGYEVNYVVRGSIRNSRTHDFSVATTAGGVNVTCGYANSTMLQNYYRNYKSLVTADAVGGTLVKLATKKLGGLCLRPAGGLYWIAEQEVDDWVRFASCVESASGSVVTTAAWEANEATITRVRESLLGDVQAECEIIVAELSDGKAHDELWYERRSKAMQRLLRKIETVESSLSVSLDDCRMRMEFVQSVFSAAAMASI